MKRVLTTALVGLLLVGMSLPLVMAKPGDETRERPDRADLRGEDRPMKNHTERPMLPKLRPSETFIVSISAQGLSQDNESYSISGEGRGIAKHRDDNGTVKTIAGFAKLNASLADENGTIVKEGTIRVRFIAHQNETGDWKWHLVSAGHTPRGLPKLFLHGENVTASEGVADLDGKGFAIVKVGEGDALQRLKLRLDAQIHLQRL